MHGGAAAGLKQRCLYCTPIVPEKLRDKVSGDVSFRRHAVELLVTKQLDAALSHKNGKSTGYIDFRSLLIVSFLSSAPHLRLSGLDQ